ncbi:MAG TPA: 50S ribosomal protein L13 [Thermoanaerobaculia bacterium]|nr:50S ribosomal protein L13 [Thermoanaerobaculia bacterium]
MSNTTYSPKRAEIERAWHVVDADGQTLGRLSSQIARLLIGKHKATWAPHLDTGDFVIVVNAEKVVLTGNKEQDKVYYRSTTRPGSLKSETAAERRRKHPERLVEAAVWGMLPKNSLGRRLYTKLKVYAGPEHPHAAQQPRPFEVAGAAR